MPAYLVFCDVDETLISCKSMLDFLYFYFGEHSATVRACLERIVTLRQRGASRSEQNRAYYRVYAGRSLTEVQLAGEEWFARRSQEQHFFIAQTRAALAEHQRSGAEIVLVSGSFAALLQPIARAVSAAHVLSTELSVERGYYTGEIVEPMIGDTKAAAVRALLAARSDVAAQDCHAYGDDASDIPMLACVGKPVAVGGDAALHAFLQARECQARSVRANRA